MSHAYDLPLALYIDGEWPGKEDRERLDVSNPANGAVIGAVPVATAADLDRALAAAQRGFSSWSMTAPEIRAGVLTRTAALIP